MRSIIHPPDVSWRAVKVWQRNRDSYKRFLKASLIGNLGEPFLYLIGMGLGVGAYLQSINGMSYIQFIGPGLVVSSAMFAATFECTFGAYTRMSEHKTYEAILSTPLSVGDIVGGEVMWGTTKGLLSGMVMLIIISLFGLVHSPMVVFLPLVVVLECFLFAAMGMTAMALSPSYEFFNYYFTLLISPMFFLSGVFFPLSRFPQWVQTLAWFSPLSHAVKASRSLILGTAGPAVILDMVWMLAIGALFFILSANLVHRRLIK